MKMDFPGIEWWRQNIVFADDSKRFFKRHFYDYYFEKYMICRHFAPAEIAEIGVRWGYSAFSFLCAAPEAAYTGFDIVTGEFGGAKTDTFAYVNLMLKQNFPDARIELRHCDTRQLKELGGYFDFIHVDGNHRENHCLHDIEMAMTACRPGGCVLIDDYTAIAGVKRAVDGYVKKNAGVIKRYHVMPSLTGEFIMVSK